MHIGDWVKVKPTTKYIEEVIKRHNDNIWVVLDSPRAFKNSNPKMDIIAGEQCVYVRHVNDKNSWRVVAIRNLELI